jgi:hypothetical protein
MLIWAHYVMPPLNAKSWRQLISSAVPDAEFANTASEQQLAAVEHALGIQLPPELRELLLELNGLRGNYGAEIVWPAEEIHKRNQEFRTSEAFKELYMPFDNLLFFGDDGGGDQFAFPIHRDGLIHKRDVFRWKHETDERIWLANCLEVFFERKCFL